MKNLDGAEMRVLLSKHATDPNYPGIEYTNGNVSSTASIARNSHIVDPEYEVVLKIHDKVALRKDVSVYSIRDDEYNYSKFKPRQEKVDLVKCTPSIEEQRFWKHKAERKE